MKNAMAKALYGAGDIVILRDGPLGHARNSTEFRILAVMPESEGQAQYRARSDAEGFERRISANDIDVEKSVAPKHAGLPPTPKGSHEPWFKPGAIGTRK